MLINNNAMAAHRPKTKKLILRVFEVFELISFQMISSLFCETVESKVFKEYISFLASSMLAA
jgi:hypothetical protein